jgi:HAE1 family hydrophobic/amphiphilic exporter-1
VIAAFLVLAGTAVLFQASPKGFLPSDDVGQLFVITEAAQDVSYDAMVRLQQQVAGIVQRNPHVENVMSFAGPAGRARRSTTAGSSSRSSRAGSGRRPSASCRSCAPR